jgi:hypothetical protein
MAQSRNTIKVLSSDHTVAQSFLEDSSFKDRKERDFAEAT